ncbi:receptor-type tyrosine-protein phosphatase beta-like [Pelobates fuscus]|uniref:receptor-type tyrosine-protein phosphatase beta-like n=1 Tax=Pelobates fuscus TaxID=191477 RepID=UPI002FE46C95
MSDVDIDSFVGFSFSIYARIIAVLQGSLTELIVHTSIALNEPMPVKQLGTNGTTTVSVFLIWNQPDEYRSDYNYRVQIENTSSVVINQTTASNQLNVTNLTPGVTYTFTVFTRAADNVTESQSVSYTTCTVPGLAQNITVNNNSTTNSLSVNWTIPAGKVDKYTVTLSGDVNRTITTNSTQVNFIDLLPGRNYSITIQTISSNCSQSEAPVIDATYPTPPNSLSFTNIGTNTISLSWGEPVNMTNVTKSFNINYSNSSSSWTVTVNTLNATLQNLTSGTNYTITVVTVGARQYQSSPVTSSIYTKPMPVKQLGTNGMTTVSVFLTWNQPDEYRSDYTYRVQIENTSSVVINQTTASNHLNVTDLTPGVTYTFTVFTRAADNVTESQSVSYTTCTVPGLAQNITVTNNNTTNSLSVNWTIPAGKVDNYTVTLNGDVNRTITTNSTQVNFIDLLPGRNYSITIQTISSNCSQSAAPVIEATYPTPPNSLSFSNIGTNTISLSWGEPVNMTNVTKSFNINYSNSSSSWTVTVNTLNATLQNLTSGTNYTITVVTVGARQYQSSPVTSSIYTKPMPVKQLGTNGMTTVSVFLTWNQPDEYRSDYTYRVQIENTSSVVINQTTASNQLNVTNLTPGVTYTFTVFTRAADNVTESQSVSYTTCSVPGLAQNITVNNNSTTNSLSVNWTIPAGKVDKYTVTLNGDVNRTITTNSTQVNFIDLLPGRNYSITIQTISSNCSQSAAPVIDATYPTPPNSLSFTNIGTNTISLSWGEPVNMTNVTKSFNINYSNSSSSWTVTVNPLNATLQNLTSGTNYTITVVTVGARQYQSSPVTSSFYTKPMPVKQLGTNGMTTVSVFLTWNQPDEYRSDYTYRVQIENTSSVVINQTTASNQLNVTDLTPGVTYTFTVFTRAADNVTESQSVSYTTCSVPGLAQNITVNNNSTTNSLSVNWTIPAGKVDKYTVTLNGDVNRTITTNSTQVDFTDLLPGRNYSITIQTISSNCSQSAAPVIDATYPTPPNSLSFSNIGTNTISLSWGEPVNMTNVTKTFNITYSNSSSSWTVSVNTLNATLQNLTSGTNYTITVVTVGARQYQSSPVTSSFYTKPMPVKQLGTNGTTTVSVFLIWNQPDEYRSDYTYRVQIENTSSVVKNQTTASNQLNVTDLTPGVTYTFTVFTRAADNVTESQSVSYTTCTVPGLAQNIAVNNNNTTNSLSVNWTIPAGKVDNYNVTLSGDVNRAITTNSTQVNFTDLLPGRNYSITIQTASSNCSQSAAPVTEATYPTPPGSLNFTNIKTNTVSLSWGEPVNMTNVTKTFNITYSNSTSSWTVSENTLNATLQNLTSGTNYTITVVTVGARQYQSSPVTSSIYTRPMSVKQLGASNVSSNYVFLLWGQPDEYRSDYTYRVQIENTPSVVINQTTASNQLNVTNLTPGVTYTFTVFTRAADNVTESQSVSYTTCTVPGLAQNIAVTNNNTTNSLSVNWTIPAGKVDNYTVTLSGDLNRTNTTNSTQVNFTDLLPGRNYSITIQTFSSNCNQSAAPVIEATYPTPPGSLNFTNITTNTVSLSWGEPVNMTNVTKTFNITYSNSTSSWTVSENTLNATLQNLTSGTNYTITVVTVGARQYQSSPVTSSIYTRPMSVKQLGASNVSSNYVFLLWGQPDEYRSDYTYRVQIENTPSVVIIQTTASNQLNVTNLTPGVTYTFTVFTRAADNVTESQSVSYTTCTVPGLAQNIAVTNNNTTNSLSVNWTIPAGKVDNYTVTLSGDLNRTNTTNSTQVNFTDLLPGRNYSITIQTASSNCSQSAAPVIEATYPTPPGSLNFTNITTNTVSLSWGEPVNMTNVTKYFNITYSNSTSSWTVSENTLNATLQNLTSGTNYTITVVTVGARQYQSSPVTSSIYTRPMSVKQLGASNVSSNYVFLLWGQPDEYRSDYTYRVQIENTPSVVINQTTASNQLNVTNLTPGVTYTFTVFTRAADNVTESQSVSYTTCTVPGLIGSQNITLSNNSTTNTLSVNWINPGGNVDNYTVTLSGDVDRTNTTNSTQVNFTDLLPGRNYSITIQTISSNCSQSAAPVIEATYPTPPSSVIFTSIGTNNISLSWGEPVNMANISKTFSIIYSNSSSFWTVSTNLLNVTLQNLTSGTNYTINVVTVGARQYQSSPVTISAYTKPNAVKLLRDNGKTSYSVSLIWDPPDEYKAEYKYRIVTATSSSVVINQTTASNQLNVTNLTPGVTYTFTVFTRAADNVTESQSVSYTTCTVPGTVSSFSCSSIKLEKSLSFIWTCPAGVYTTFTLSLYNTNNSILSTTVINQTCTNDIQTYIQPGVQYNTNYTANISTSMQSCSQISDDVMIANCLTSIGPPIQINTTDYSIIGPPTFNQFDYTFNEFDASNGPIAAYAVIVTTQNVAGTFPTKDILSKTYADFKSKTTTAYVTQIIENGQKILSNRAISTKTVRIGEASQTYGYTNGPLEPLTSYWVAVAGFTNLTITSGIISAENSVFSFAPYALATTTTQNPGVIVGAVVGCILGVIVIGIMGFFIWRRRRQGDKKETFDGAKMSRMAKVQGIKTSSFASHFAKQHADSNLGFRREYENFGSVGVMQPKAAAENPENRAKNRYNNVLPYDISRVKLSIMDNPTDDFVNANYIPGYKTEKEFIASQGPLPHTVNDFWRMIWEKQVHAIVMLTRCVEMGKVKCEEYWPSKQVKQFNGLSVSMKSASVFSEWTIRDFQVTNVRSRQSQQVRHFHFTAWPDHGVPETTDVLISFRNLICDYMKNCPQSPILVHCSAGVGRTGTLIALDRIIKQIEAEDRVDVYGIVHDLRMHRCLMVQTDSQYIFLNQCALDFIKCREVPKPDLIYHNASAIYENFSPSSVYNRTNV